MEDMPVETAKPEFKTPEAALATLGRTHEAMAQATDKTPSTVVRAFEPEQLTVGKLVIPPVNMRRWMLLEKIKSPFLTGGSDITMQELMATFYVLVRPSPEVADVLAAHAFDRAVEEFAETVPLSSLGELSRKIGEHLAREFEPQADFVRHEEAGGGPKLKASSATEQGAG